MTRSITILSPHLDDAVLSCWHVLDGPGDVSVVNVFAGVPAASCDLPEWDRVTGATNSSRRVIERQAEDAEALSLAGRRAVNLGFLDEQYRLEEQLLGPLIDHVLAALVPGSTLYAPASLGEHPDHDLVRALGLELHSRGFAVRLYADLPHAVRFGWPAWVTASNGQSDVDVDAFWTGRLTSVGLSRERLTPTVRRLTAENQDRKLAAVTTYRTQWPALERITPPGALEYEVEWVLAP